MRLQIFTLGKGKQVRVLDILIFLENVGLISLDALTDESQIRIQ